MDELEQRRQRASKGGQYLANEIATLLSLDSDLRALGIVVRVDRNEVQVDIDGKQFVVSVDEAPVGG
jgi:hypothetical protein